MKFRLTRRYRKQYAKLPPVIQKKVNRQLRCLAEDIRHPSLQSKKMVNRANIWEARIDLSYRMTFQIQKDIVILRQVGTHEIYRTK